MQLTTLAITFALAATASADTLRGATNTATLDQLASPDLHCNQKSHTATDCADVVSSDGSSCVWCQTSEEQGACLSQSDADSVLNLFNLPCPAYSALLEEEESESSTDEDEDEEDSMDEEEEDVEVSL
mmetsp:Transcript_33178/g.56217  ORF Transcript_33178/g.56217 Transcript_33178/m.56217 type:complete len:128 (-) Transcript_33178:183-566(-)